MDDDDDDSTSSSSGKSGKSGGSSSSTSDKDDNNEDYPTMGWISPAVKPDRWVAWPADNEDDDDYTKLRQVRR